MKFYTDIRMEPQSSFQEICENPFLVFSKDLIHCLSLLHDLDWSPNTSACRSYQPHPLSPFTQNVRTALMWVTHKSELDYEKLYDEFVPINYEHKLAVFINRAFQVLDKLNDNPLDDFFTLLHLGRWTMSFYKHGTKDAAHLVPHLMAGAIKNIAENSSSWFFKFDLIAQDLIELFNDGYSEGFEEEGRHYYEELCESEDEEDSDEDEDIDEEDDFDECSTCICGQCADLIEFSEECGDYDDHSPSIYSVESSDEYENTESGEVLDVLHEEENEDGE